MIIEIDYPVEPKGRYWPGNPHAQLYDIINQRRESYKNLLRNFLEYKQFAVAIPTAIQVGQKIYQETGLKFENLEQMVRENRLSPQIAQTVNQIIQDAAESLDPTWINDWIPGLDTVTLYSFLATTRPKRYFEVGSGNSTKFARRAIQDHALPTTITSIDPNPRASIDRLCNQVIRTGVENVDLSIFQQLEAGDILFVDCSHCVFTNSDANVLLIEVLPTLKPGVLVQFHDICLPYDYPDCYRERYYSEQYLLAAYLLAEGSKFEIVLPNYFISHDDELKSILSPLWNDPKMQGVQTHGCSFWLRVR